MAGTPMRITLYTEESEVKRTYTRSCVNWRLLKNAVKIAKKLNTDEGVNALAVLVVDAFGCQFSVEELISGADKGEMMSVMNTIITKARDATKLYATEAQANAPSDVTDADSMIDTEISLVQAFGWSLHDIDETDIESLIPFMYRLSEGKKISRNAFCDQVDFL
jgi:hypothetical protein